MTLLTLLLVIAATDIETPDLAPPEVHAANAELDAYLNEAAENNPSLQMRFAEWRAALARVPQVTSLDDPQLTYTQFLQSDQQRFGIALMQMFPWFGTLRLRGEQAAAEADAALARVYAVRNKLYAEVKEAYFEYAFLRDSIETTKRQAEILTEVEDIVGTRYSLGLAAEADLLRVQMEQSQLEDMYNQFLQQRSAFSQRLASAIGREAAAELPWPETTSEPPPPPLAPAVLAWLRMKNPALQESDATIESRRHGIELARKSGRPNFTLGIEFNDMKQPEGMGPEWPYMYGVDTVRGFLTGDGEMVAGARNEAISEAIADRIMPNEDPMSDEIMISVGINVPIWRKRVRAGILEAKEMEQAAIYEKHDRILELDAEARMALFEIQDGARRYALYRDVLVPRARQTYDSLQSRYSTGDEDAGFIDILGSVQSLLNYELEQIRAQRDIHIGTARLEAIMGGPWPTAATTDFPAVDQITAPEPPAVPGNADVSIFGAEPIEAQDDTKDPPSEE